MRVAHDVREGLLRDAKDRDRNRRRDVLVIAAPVEMDAEPGLGADAVDKPLEPSMKSEIVEDARTELHREVAHAIQRVDDERAQLIELVAHGGIGGHALDELKSDQEEGEGLTGLIVELARDADALGLLGGQDPRRQGARTAPIDLELGDRSGHGPTVGWHADRGIRLSALILGPFGPRVACGAPSVFAGSHMRILFATDGSRGAGVAEDFLLSLPLSCADDVTVVMVPSGSDNEAHEIVSKCRWRLAGRHVPVTTLLLRHGSPAEILESVALERASELIVIGSRGRGTLAGTVLGSMARALARTAPVPVLVVRSRREAPRHVLLAIDDSIDGRAAVDALVKLPIPRMARITVVHILAAATGEPVWLDVAEFARQRFGDRISDQVLVERGHVGDEVLRRGIIDGTDLIVLGVRDQTQGTGLLNTSVADHVLANAHCAVLVAKAPTQARTVNLGIRADMVAFGLTHEARA